MKLLIAIVDKADAPQVTGALTKEGFSSTMTSGTGGFLNVENAIIFSGVENRCVGGVLDIIARNTHSRESSAPQGVEFGFTLPEKVRVGGASVFILDVDRFIKL